MKSVVCILTRKGEVLLLRGEGEMLTALETEVRAGESPIEASVRVIKEQTGQLLSPSCAGLYFRLKPGHLTDDGLAFVAEVPAEKVVSGSLAGEQEWVALGSIRSRADVSSSDQQLIVRFLSADHPLVVILAEGENAEPAAESEVAVSALDPAVLSPLVFAVQS